MTLLLLATLGCRNKDEVNYDSDPEVVDSDAPADADGDGSLDEDDCAPDDPSVFPGATETCNEIDDNCDGQVDEGVTSTFYADADGDLHGDASVEIQACEAPEGYVASPADDCDDADPTTFPGAGERCDGVDNDCDGSVDEDVLDTWYADADGDSYGDPDSVIEDCNPPANSSSNDLDCDDAEAASYPGNTEICDELDNNCDGQVDEGVTTTFYADDDGDGYGDGGDLEACEQPSGYASEDGDCDDASGDVNPDATELCDGVDNDCDGDADEDDAADAGTYYPDADGDGYGSSAYSWTQCEQPSGTVTDATDCDDTESSTYPGADEYCDSVDSDCDGTTDDGDELDATTWYADSDGDGYGDARSTTDACDVPSGYTDDIQDCDDSDSGVYPYAPETGGDGVDSNCDGDDGCLDLDCDGYADLVFPEYYTGSAYSTSSEWFSYDTSSGDYSSGAANTLTTNGGSFDGAAADLDQDGYVDLIFASYYYGGYGADSIIFWGSSSGYSSSDTTDLGTSGARAVDTGDVNGDGYLDVVIGSYYSGSSYSSTSYVFYGSSTGLDGSDYDTMSAAGVVDLEVEDLDGDGYEEVILCSYYSGSSYSSSSYVYYGGSSGLSGSSDALASYGCFDLDIADYNGDGLEDIAVANYPTTTSYVYYGTSSGYSSSYRDSFTANYPGAVESADLDDDGTLDLVWGGYRGTMNVYYNDSTLGFGSSYDSFSAGYGMWDLEIADLDSDGYEDVVAAVYHDGSDYYADSVVFWGASGGFDDSDVTELETEGALYLDVGDVNGDGYPELAFSGYYTGSWSTLATSYVYFGSSSGYSSSDVDEVSSGGHYAAPMLVGDTDW
jgi:hypothetical protein